MLVHMFMFKFMFMCMYRNMNKYINIYINMFKTITFSCSGTLIFVLMFMSRSWSWSWSCPCACPCQCPNICTYSCSCTCSFKFTYTPPALHPCLAWTQKSIYINLGPNSGNALHLEQWSNLVLQTGSDQRPWGNKIKIVELRSPKYVEFSPLWVKILADIYPNISRQIYSAPYLSVIFESVTLIYTILKKKRQGFQRNIQNIFLDLHIQEPIVNCQYQYNFSLGWQVKKNSLKIKLI